MTDPEITVPNLRHEAGVLKSAINLLIARGQLSVAALDAALADVPPSAPVGASDPSETIEIRKDERGEVDEVVGRGLLHLERMSDSHFMLIHYGLAGDELRLTIGSKGKAHVVATVTDYDAAPLPPVEPAGASLGNRKAPTPPPTNQVKPAPPPAPPRPIEPMRSVMPLSRCAFGQHEWNGVNATGPCICGELTISRTAR